ncbi:MAG: ROK family protein [Candidatus Pacebacteria bacterium]|nr:ROK family protein [Candidatus Paceibacterota bacterium]
MNSKTIGHPEILKNLNKYQMLNLIREDGPLSRTEIARQTRLGWGTITKYAAELLDEQAILETFEKANKGQGRRAKKLTVNPDKGWIVGVELGSYATRIIVVDFSGRIVYRTYLLTNSADGRQEVLETLSQRIAESIDKAGCSLDSIIGMCVGAVGQVDHTEGCVLKTANFSDFNDVPLRDYLSEEFRCPVYVEQAQLVITLGEMWRGGGKGVSDFICLTLGNGIGSGIVSMGRLLRPYPFKGIGDIGHLTIDKNGPQCTCGNKGCLEAVAGGAALLRQLRAISPDITFEKIESNPALQSSEIRRIIREAGVSIATALTSAIQIYHPEKVIVSGGLTKLGDPLMSPIQKEIEARLPIRKFDVSHLEITQLGDWAGALGAARFVWEETFTHKVEYV